MAIPIIQRSPINHGGAFDEILFEEFSCRVPSFSGPTFDPVGRPPDVFVERKMYHGKFIPLPDGNEIEVWGFENPDHPTEREQHPSEPIRVREGQLFHGLLGTRRGTHTIHWHGIEPTSFNDGVGHNSFEVSGNYTYQWQAAEAGTYFYHCHKNTVLHFEMGMFGYLIVDPPQGPGFCYRGNDIIPYDLEVLWATDDMDIVWHNVISEDVDAGIDCPFGPDAGLNNFNPTYFFISGVPHPLCRTDPKTVVNAQVGQTILIRLLCAGYHVQRYTLELDAEVIAQDGRTYGKAPFCRYSHPYAQPANTPFILTTSQRRDLLVRPTTPGSFLFKVEFLHPVTGAVAGIAETFIHVAA